MKLCITEKPSVAKDIATILGGANVPRREGYFDCGEYYVTWTYGHLCTLKEPADYTDMWKRWSLGSLPMIPERFGIKLIDDEGYKRQFHVIETLIGQAEMIINCGDAGQEGELIQRWVMQKAGAGCPVMRLWISSLTDESIREGFARLRPQKEFENLYLAGLSRAIGDWILGMNATRLYSLKYSEPGKVLSIGRVQTPTLAIIVKRQREIENFVPKDYWELKTLYRDVTFNATAGRFDSAEEAEKAAASIAPLPLQITDVQQKKGREAPPRLFDLTSLQVECNRRWGWTADQTLKLIQTLYEKKVTTYPRVDTTYLSEDIYPKIPDILRKMTAYASVTQSVLAGRIQKSKKVFDNSKVTDHHAIIPTGQPPTTLAGDERQLYHIIALRFVSAFYPDCQFLQTTVLARAGELDFKATGKVITDQGWRKVYAEMDKRNAQKDNDDGDQADRMLPPMSIGEQGPHQPSVVKKTTQPPKPYTEGTLLRAMESAGKTVDDEELREAMKENGIGRPSTRAAIIETLFKRGYIRRERKAIAACDAGVELIDLIHEDMLKSASLTGIWENKLRRIERGDYSPAEFVDELKGQIASIVQTVLSDNSNRRVHVVTAEESRKAAKPDKPASKQPAKRAPAVRKLEAIVCPLCGKGHLLKGRMAYGCSCYKEGCTLRLPFEEFPADLTPGKLNSAIKKKFKKQTQTR